MNAVTRLREEEVPEAAAREIERLHPKKSLWKSEALGCAFLFGLGGFGLFASGAVELAREGLGGWAVARLLGGLLLLAMTVSSFFMAKRSRFGEFELSSAAWYVRGNGLNLVEVFCWGRCTDVQFVKVLQNGLYSGTKLVCRFGDGGPDGGKLEFVANLDRAIRERPSEHPRFKTILTGVERARRLMASGEYATLDGAPLFLDVASRPPADPPPGR